jgi:uncharacterized protein (DUF2267 family)
MMSDNGLPVFDKTLQTTHIWLGEIMEELGPDRALAWKALSVVLRELRDRLPIGLSAHLGSELPLLVRGAYYDQYTPALQPTNLDLEGFVDAVTVGLRDARAVDPRLATRAVLQTLSRHIPAGQIAKVQDALPQRLRDFWQGAEERVTPPPTRGRRGDGRQARRPDA